MKKIKQLTLLLALISFANLALAQPVPGDDGPGSPCEFLPPEFQPDDCIPVDDYMYILAMAGMLAAAKYRKKLFA